MLEKEEYDIQRKIICNNKNRSKEKMQKTELKIIEMPEYTKMKLPTKHNINE